MKTVKDVQDLVDTLSAANVERREILRLAFAVEHDVLHSSTLEVCGFGRSEVRAHLASLAFEGYVWTYEAQGLRIGGVYTLRTPHPLSTKEPA